VDCDRRWRGRPPQRIRRPVQEELAPKDGSDNQTLDSINKLSWREFERLVAAAYAQKGYAAKELGGSSPDGGKDVRLAGNGETVLVQCKHWKSRQVGVPVIREAYGVLMHEKVDRSVVVTAGTFTSEAIAFAQGKHPVGRRKGFGGATCCCAVCAAIGVR
jgi:restriction endonuclease Mrr